MEDYRRLEIKVKHARELKNVNILSKMDPYVVAFISSDPNTKHKTPVDRTGNRNPTWDYSAKFVVDVAAARRVRPMLVFAISCNRALGDKPIGEVHVPLTDLLNTPEDDGMPCHVAYQVRDPSGRAKGELDFSYHWEEKLAGAQPPATAAGKVEEPVAAYPMVAGISSGFYPTVSVPGKVDDPVTAYPTEPGMSSGFYPPVPGYGPAPLGGYAQQYPPVVASYAGYPPPHQYGRYPPPHQYGGYPPPPDPRYEYQAQAGYGYPPMRRE